MKKFTVLVALVLLAAAGTSYAVTCSYDNVPGATLLVPYWKVSRGGITSASTDIPASGINTLVAITNVSEWGAIAHVTVWNKQSVAVLDFNVPMTGYDVATFNMRDVLNGNLNVNPTVQNATVAAKIDPCQNLATYLGNTADDFIRFTNPEATLGTTINDFTMSLGYYDTPAYTGAFRQKVWYSLDEGYDIDSLTTAPAAEASTPVCDKKAASGSLKGDFTGYLTIDVVNFCTNYFPDESAFYNNDAIATSGWEDNTPNVLMGDIFFVDEDPTGNISGDVAVSLEFDNRLDWTVDKTFYNRYTVDSSSGAIIDAGTGQGVFSYVGDGREPLGTFYGFRFLNVAPAATSTISVWRSDVWEDSTGDQSSNLCDLDYNTIPVWIVTRDEDENVNETQIGGGPSGDEPLEVFPYIWWETQRITLAGNVDVNPAEYEFGWTTIWFPPADTATVPTYRFNQAYVGVEHTAQGQFVSVGHAATLIDNQFVCGSDAITEMGNQGW